jgi:tetratricopeptide (TPR) repeat protein
MVRAAPKEKKMKRKLSLWLSLPAAAGLLAFAMMPAFAQQSTAPAATGPGKIHGHITNPTGQPQPGGEIGLSTDGGATLKYTFPVDDNGDYTGQAPAGTYTVVYREKDTPAGKMVDDLTNVKIEAGQDTTADIDMSRAAYIAKMTPEQQKQLEELKKQNAAAINANKVINNLNADLRTVNSDIKDADGARNAAIQQLGSSATPAAVDAKVQEIQSAKYNDVVTLMTKDTAVKPDQSILWTELARGQLGLKQYDQAITNFQKALTLEQASKKPSPEILGTIESGMGECYARSGKVPEANAAFDAAAKDDPTRASFYLRNEAVIFFQAHNTTAQVAAADEAIKADPSLAILYYIKGQGLVQNATVDPKTQRIVLPPDCTAAYQKYLELAPDGPFAAEVKGILSQAGEKIQSSYRAGKH